MSHIDELKKDLERMCNSKNLYVDQAQVFIIDDEGDTFVIGYIKVRHDYTTPEEPTFWRDKTVGAKVLRTAGFADERTRRILYHAESSEQAEAILKLFLQKKRLFNKRLSSSF